MEAGIKNRSSTEERLDFYLVGGMVSVKAGAMSGFGWKKWVGIHQAAKLFWAEKRKRRSKNKDV